MPPLDRVLALSFVQVMVGLVPLAMAAGEPGKEILYPVATVIIGGLISSTLLEFLVRPALFWKSGLRAGQRVVGESKQQV